MKEHIERAIDLEALSKKGKPRFTDREVEDAKAVRRVLGHEYRLERTPEGTISFGGLILSTQLFPSIQPGQSYTLDEIIGGAE